MVLKLVSKTFHSDLRQETAKLTMNFIDADGGEVIAVCYYTAMEKADTQMQIGNIYMISDASFQFHTEPFTTRLHEFYLKFTVDTEVNKI